MIAEGGVAQDAGYFVGAHNADIAELEAHIGELETLCEALLGHWPPTSVDVANYRRLYNDLKNPQFGRIAAALEALAEEESWAYKRRLWT